MKALVLAGGSGTRLRPITYTSAKQLVPLANVPILMYGLGAIADAGISEVGVVVGDTADEIAAALGDGSNLGISVTYLRQDAPRGLAHAVHIARDFLGDDPFVMYLGDNLVVGGISEMVARFASDSADAMVLLKSVAHPEQFGVAERDAHGAVIRLVEKPAVPASDLALVGVYLFRSRIHDAVAAIAPSARGELEITDAIQWLIDHDARVEAHVLEQPWVDTGKLTDLLDANAIVLDRQIGRIEGTVDDRTTVEGEVVVSPGAVVEESILQGPCIIGAGAHLQRVTVEPHTAIGSGCHLNDARVGYSVVLERVTARGVTIRHSLIGRDSQVIGTGESKITAHIGDHAVVELS